MNFAVNAPINNLSFGQVSIALLREFYVKGLQPCLFPIGGKVEVGSQKIDEDFKKWIESCMRKGLAAHSRRIPAFKLWHLHDYDSVSEKQLLYSFYELDSPTQVELNIARNQNKLAFSNDYSCSQFTNMGINSVVKIPLGFDSTNFSRKGDNKNENKITFNLLGKFEKRKHHAKVIKAWLKEFGNKPEFFLNCAIYNPFFSPEDNKNVCSGVIEGKHYFNIQFFNFIESNAAYNDFLNHGNIVIGMSGAEGWGLGEFQSIALGKHGVILDAHGHKEWANNDNATLVRPSNMIDAYDGTFFHKGQIFNQGSIFDWKDEDFIAGCYKAIKQYRNAPLNSKGIELQSRFTYSKMADSVISELEKL